MFKDKSLFVILESGKTDEIARIELTKDTQKDVCKLFESAYNELAKNKTTISFTGTYKPDKNEILTIADFSVDGLILDAIKDPIGVKAFRPNLKNLPDIKPCLSENELLAKEK